MVSTTAMGSTSWSRALVSKSSHTSPSTQAPLAMAFAESMTEPPPTASTQSTLASLQRRTPSRTRVISGFGRTPPSSKCSMPAASSDAPTRSISPEATALPPPKCTSTRLAPAAASFSPTCSSAPRPKTKCVGETNSKFSMGVLSAFRHGDALSLSPHHRRRARSPIILCVDARASPANRQLSDHGKMSRNLSKQGSLSQNCTQTPAWSGRLFPVSAGYEVGHFRGGFGGYVGLGGQALVMGYQVVCLAQFAGSKNRGVFVIRGDIAVVAS